MVCLGNICRSPLAEGILQHKAKAAGLLWEVDSAGTSNYHIGEPPHRLSQKIALQHGIDISQQKARQFTARDMLTFDKIFVMDTGNYADVQRIAGKYWDASKVDLLLNAIHPHNQQNVPDPWYGNEDDYHQVFNLISEACDCIITKAQKGQH